MKLEPLNPYLTSLKVIYDLAEKIALLCNVHETK